MKHIYSRLFLALSLAVTFTSCDKDDPEDGGFQQGGLLGLSRYVIAATPVGTEGIADILLTTNDIEQGSITTIGNGVEQDGSYRYYTTHKGKFFSLLYGQGNPGAVTTYGLDRDGQLRKISNFQTETVQVFSSVNDELLLIKVPRSGNENAVAIRIDAQNPGIISEKQINIVQLAGNGERAHFTGATQVGDKVFAPYRSIKGCCGDAFGTAYPDSSWIAVFSYPDLKLEKVIKDNRTSYIGDYFTSGLAVTENGDIYGYSPANAKNGRGYTSKNPSAFVRVLKGTTEFDKSYFFNVQEKSGGHHISSQTYLGNGKFLLMMYGMPNSFDGNGKLALVDVYQQSFTWVKGAPEEIRSATAPYNNNTAALDGKTAYIGLNTPGGSWVYKIDIATATASKGLEVKGGAITSIVRVDY
ncbi:DUF4374 domain-containing protein [Chitinophaga pendula]|uniref:DUF4374 domain-containing protein n=1 Tax=Chitinophaga TaxID=79328 RepID=UPI000BAEFC9A|nr:MULTISPECIES: DUF4374 domain-containing protein [Chitinophaga]ASZ14105.1 hypothetical protein CK934_25715 [Chitinophaga sp. MD30]UCJ08263.1 DUF4374 domain-containing protein [Chitinophaga pendula]